MARNQTMSCTNMEISTRVGKGRVIKQAKFPYNRLSISQDSWGPCEPQNTYIYKSFIQVKQNCRRSWRHKVTSILYSDGETDGLTG